MAKNSICGIAMSSLLKWNDILFRLREDSQWAWKHTLYHTEEAGFERGIEQGIEAYKLEIAKKALKVGISMEMVGQVTGVDLSAISRLKLELEEA